MKFLVLVSMIGVACAARLENTYIPPSSASGAGGYNLQAPKQAFASNIQNQYQAPGNNFQQQQQQQQVNRPGLNQGTFTSQSAGKGFQSVSAGSYSSNQGSYNQQPQQQQQQNYNQQQSSQQSYNNNAQQGSYQAPAQQNYNQQQSYNNGPSTTPIPILKCK